MKRTGDSDESHLGAESESSEEEDFEEQEQDQGDGEGEVDEEERALDEKLRRTRERYEQALDRQGVKQAILDA